MSRSGSEGWQGNYKKVLEGCKNCECYVYTEIQGTNIVNSRFLHCFFSMCFFCAHYFSFALFAIIRTTKWLKTHINKVSNIKIINYNYEIMAKNQDITSIMELYIEYWIIRNWILSYWIFRKKYLISSYLGVTLSSCNISYNFR